MDECSTVNTTSKVSTVSKKKSGSWLGDKSEQKARGEGTIPTFPLFPTQPQRAQSVWLSASHATIHALLPSHGGDSACHGCQHQDPCTSVGNKVEI